MSTTSNMRDAIESLSSSIKACDTLARTSRLDGQWDDASRFSERAGNLSAARSILRAVALSQGDYKLGLGE